MKKQIASAALSAVMLSSSLIGVNAANIDKFIDVPSGAWYRSAVEYILDKEIMIGKSDDSFAPLEEMTRAQFVTILSRLSGENSEGMREKLEFSDVDKSAWYADDLGWAVSEKLAEGYPDGTFKPNSPISRQELATLFDKFMTSRFIELTSKSLTDAFSDADDIAEYAAEAVDRIRSVGMVEGDENGAFNPEDSTKRAEIAALLVRYLEAYPNRRDEMHKRLENIYEIIPTSGIKRVELDFLNSDMLTLENFNARLLPKIGLDTENYELIIDEEDLEELREKYREVPDTYTTALSVGIRNKKTGDETAKRRITFKLNKAGEGIYVDPDDFDPGIDPEIYAHMMDVSLYSTGDIARLASALKKAENGEEITVSYIGGSITEGAGSTHGSSWAEISYNYLTKRYPNAKINYNNAGVGGTPSIFGNMRLERDVLSKNPDIIFVEFAVNDRTDPIYQESFECLVRSALESKNNPAVIIMLSVGRGGLDSTTRPFIKQVGQRYDVPVIDANNAVWEQLNNGLFTLKDFAPDEVHPCDWGYQIMSDTVENLYKTVAEKMKTASEEELRIKPVEAEPITPLRYMNLTYAGNNNLNITNLGGWKNGHSPESAFGDSYPEGFHHKNSYGNEPLEFTFTGKNLLIKSDVPVAGLFVSIDGGEYFPGSHPVYLLYSSDTEGTHTVRVKTGEYDGDEIIRISGFAYN